MLAVNMVNSHRLDKPLSKQGIMHALNEREVDVLALWVCGHTAKSAANILGKSNRTVEYYRERIKIKLNVANFQDVHHEVFVIGELPSLLNHAVNLLV